MKKLIALLIALVMVFGVVAACGGGSDDPVPTPTPVPASDPDPTPTPTADPDPTQAPEDDDPPPPPPEAPQAARPISDNLVYWAGDSDFAGYADPDALPGATVIGDGDAISDRGSGYTMYAGLDDGMIYTRSNGPGVTVAGRVNPWDSLDVGFTDLPTGDYLLMAKVSAASEIDFWLQLEADNWQNSSGEGGCFGITRLNGVSSGTLTTFISVKNIADYETTVDQNRVRINASEGENYNIEAIAIYKAEPGQIYDGSFDMVAFGKGFIDDLPGADWPAWQDNVQSDGAGRVCRAGGSFVAYTDEGYLEIDERPWVWDSVDLLIGGLEDGEYTIVVSFLSNQEYEFQIRYEDLPDDNPNKHLDSATGTEVTLTGTFVTEAPWVGSENGNRIRMNTTNADEPYFITSIKLFKNS